MSAPTYRPGDIAMVDVEGHGDAMPCVLISKGRWQALDGAWTCVTGEVGPVLGNVGDIAAMMTKADRAFEEPIDLDDPYTMAYVKGRNHRLDEIGALQGQVREAKQKALAEVREGLSAALRVGNYIPQVAFDVVNDVAQEAP